MILREANADKVIFEYSVSRQPHIQIFLSEDHGQWLAEVQVNVHLPVTQNRLARFSAKAPYLSELCKVLLVRFADMEAKGLISHA